jgi:hypothetical protein
MALENLDAMAHSRKGKTKRDQFSNQFFFSNFVAAPRLCSEHFAKRGGTLRREG